MLLEVQVGDAGWYFSRFQFHFGIFFFGGSGLVFFLDGLFPHGWPVLDCFCLCYGIILSYLCAAGRRVFSGVRFPASTFPKYIPADTW